MDTNKRQALISKLQRDLDRLERIPLKRREAEHADIAQETCRAMLSDLRAGRPLVPVADAAAVWEDELVKLLRDFERDA